MDKDRWPEECNSGYDKKKKKNEQGHEASQILLHGT